MGASPRPQTHLRTLQLQLSSAKRAMVTMQPCRTPTTELVRCYNCWIARQSYAARHSSQFMETTVRAVHPDSSAAAACDASLLTLARRLSAFGRTGWQLGENGEYCKHTLFENALRTPLMIRVPWLPHTFGAMTTSLVELLDVFPTLQDLAGFPVSPELEGVSQAGVIRALGLHGEAAPLSSPRTVALAQFPRCIAAGSENASRYWDANNCNSNTSDQYTAMGMTMRTADGWRFTRWLHWDGTALRPDWERQPFGEELYDHRSEPALGSFDSQSANLAADPKYTQLVARLRKELQTAFAPRPPTAFRNHAGLESDDEERTPSQWRCVVLSNRTISNRTDVRWARQNCTGTVGSVNIAGIVVNIVQATVRPSGPAAAVAQAVVTQPQLGLVPLSTLAELASNDSNRSFVPLAGVNGGYFWRLDSEHFVDDVCWGKTRADAELNASSTDPNAGIGDSLTIIDGVIASSNCDKRGNSRPAVAVLDAPMHIEVLARGGRAKPGVSHAIGAGPNLVSHDHTTGKSFIDISGDNINILERASNTALALRRREDGAQELLLVTFDGHDGCTEYGNCGVNAHQFAAFLLDHLHVNSAMNMDQGGSTTMWVRDNGIVSNPGASERNIYNGVFIGEHTHHRVNAE